MMRSVDPALLTSGLDVDESSQVDQFELGVAGADQIAELFLVFDFVQLSHNVHRKFRFLLQR